MSQSAHWLHCPSPGPWREAERPDRDLEIGGLSQREARSPATSLPVRPWAQLLSHLTMSPQGAETSRDLCERQTGGRLLQTLVGYPLTSTIHPSCWQVGF